VSIVRHVGAFWITFVGPCVGAQAAPQVASDAPAAAAEDPLLAAVDAWLRLPPAQRAQKVPRAPVPKAAVEAVAQRVYAALRDEALAERKEELRRAPVGKSGKTLQWTVHAAGKEMKVLERTFGDAPVGERSLWISMHGGCGAPASVNDQQWRNQIGLYSPAEGFYVAPRAPTNTWNLWHEAHIDALFDRLIESYVIDRGVDPDRVYLMGYSAGGDGVYQLAPRMADRFAAASMMAGHPNGVSMLGLRNLPFMIWVGAGDGAYDRNEVAAQWGAKLDALAAADPSGYEHETHLVAGKGHWMDLEDAAAVPWMARHRRVTWPDRVVWQRSARTHDRFYWLAVPAGQAAKGQLVEAQVTGQSIALKTDGVPQLRLRLCDALLDLDQRIEVERNGTRVFSGKVQRSVAAIYESLTERLDPKSAATAFVDIGR